MTMMWLLFSLWQDVLRTCRRYNGLAWMWVRMLVVLVYFWLLMGLCVHGRLAMWIRCCWILMLLRRFRVRYATRRLYERAGYYWNRN